MSAAPASRFPRGIALYALVICVLAVAAAVFSFAGGSWPLGIVWILLAGLTSNMSWYYLRRDRARRAAAEAGEDGRASASA